ncbi:DUF6380 family protein [Streptomyces avermitilis]
MDHVGQDDGGGEKWHATLRWRTASLTATACRAPFKHCGGPAGEDAR